MFNWGCYMEELGLICKLVKKKERGTVTEMAKYESFFVQLKILFC